MLTLVLENIPAPLYDQIQELAKIQHRTPADTALEVLESAFRTTTPTRSEAPFLSEEICAPFDIPWPKGERVVPIEIANYLPEPHDIPITE